MCSHFSFAFSSLSTEQLQESLKDIESVTLLELPNNMYQNRGIEGPVLLQNHPFVQPFEGVIKTDTSAKFDATALIAAIILIASAILLGDIAVGLFIFVIGLLLDTKKERNIGRILNRLGIAITIGGLLSGTIGYQWSLYSPIFTLSLSKGIAFIIWIFVIIGARIMIKGIQKITNNQK